MCRTEGAASTPNADRGASEPASGRRQAIKHLPSSPWLRRYSLAVGLVLLAGLIRAALTPLVGLKLAAPLFYPAVLLSAWFGGFGPGLLGTLLSAMAVAYFLPPADSLAIADLVDLMGFALFVCICLLMTFLGERRLRRLRHAMALLVEVRRSEQRYRDLFASNLAGIFIVSRDGRVLESNDTFARLLGYESRQEVRDHDAREFYLDPKDHEEVLARLRPGTVISSRDVQWRRRDGTPVWVLLHMREEEGGVVESIAIDVSDRRRSEHAER